MEGAANSDEAMLGVYADALASGIELALPAWVLRCVTGIIDAWVAATGARGEPLTQVTQVTQAAVVAGGEAAATIGPRVRAVLATDVDRQTTSPLAVVREAVRWPTAVLTEAGVPRVERDAFAERTFPDDIYDLAPASLADLDPALQEAGIAWGAAKAHIVLARRRAEGKR